MRQYVLLTLVLSLLSCPVLGQVNVLTWHNDLARTGQNLKETQLSPVTVNPDTFGRLWSVSVDGYVFAQPLFMQSVTIPGKGVHNAVFVATEHDSVYAFDADAAGSPLWKVSFIDPAAGITTMPESDTTSHVIPNEVGITGTPAIDGQTGTLYVVAKTKEVVGGIATWHQRLHALDVTTGAERPGSPVEIAATVTGAGNGGDGAGNIAFNARYQNQRPGLVLYNGAVYIGWAAHGDHPDMHGWVIGYDAQTLQRVAVFNTSPDANLGTLWQSGGAMAVDPNGFLYFETGNGPFTANSGGRDFGDSFLKLSTTGGLAALDYFTPYNQSDLNARDIDLGAGGVVILPESAGSVAHPRLLVGACKDGSIYLLDRDNLGHFNASGDTQIVQWLPNVLGPVRSLPAYFDGLLYFATYGDVLKAYRITDGQLTTTPVMQATHTLQYPGSTPSVSANGDAADPGATAVVWLVDPGQGTQPAGLLAYAARDLSKPLFDSRSLARADDAGQYVHFSLPTVANGKVYVGTRNTLVTYGLGAWTPVPDISPATGSYTGPQTVTITDRMSGAEIHYTTDGSTPSRTSALYTDPFEVSQCTRVRAIAYSATARDSGIGESFIEIYDGPGNGDGLTGSYFPNTTFSGAPVFRVDPVIDFHWKDLDPIPGVSAKYFSVRWTGAIEPHCSDVYTFYVNSDDGARLFVDGKSVVSNWGPHPEAETSGTIFLQAGRRYAIRMEFWQQTMFAIAQLSWSTPGRSKETVPQSRLYSAPVPVSVSFSSSSATGGASLTGTVKISHPAPGAGLTVALVSAQPAEAAVPQTVTVPAGATSATFAVTTSPVAIDRKDTITATAGMVDATGAFTLKAPALSGLSVSPSSFTGGAPASGKITLSGVVATGTGGATVMLSASGPVSVPASVTVPEGAKTTSFPVSSTPQVTDAAATVTASYGAVAKTANLVVKAPVLKSLTLSPTSLTGGGTAKGTVSLTGIAAVDIVVSLSASRGEASVPASVTVPAGASSAKFTIPTTPVAASTAVTISAAAGSITKTATLTVKP